MDAWQKFKQAVGTCGPIAPGTGVLVAVSGGPDSVCLAHMLWRLGKTLPFRLVFAHLDHGLRAESGQDAAAVRRLGARLGVPTVVDAIPVGGHARAAGISLETAGRELRYDALAAIAARFRCRIIMTGHTANDSAETVLLWLIRGTGLDGLAGIPSRRPLGRRTIVRPLLAVTRAEIMAYLRAQKITYRIDRSNQSDAFTRNRVRHRLMPALERFNPRIVEHLATLARTCAEDAVVLRQAASRALQRCVRQDNDRIHLDLNMFFRYNKPTQARILKAILPEKKTAAHIALLMRRVSADRDGTWQFSGSWDVTKKGPSLRFTRRRVRTRTDR